MSSQSHTAPGFPTANPAYSYVAPTPEPVRRQEEKKGSISSVAAFVAVAALFVAGGVALGILALVHSGPFASAKQDSSSTGTLTTPSGHVLGNAFRIGLPKDWRRVSTQSVAANSGALAALKQTQGLGLIVIRRDGPATHLTGRFLVQLDHKIRSETPDYKAVGWRLIEVGAGRGATKALLFTYLRTAKHEIHTVTVVPAGDHSFVIAAVDAAGSPTVAKEVGAIIRSFTLT